MIPTHDCAAYLRETLASVAAQDPGAERMQVAAVAAARYAPAARRRPTT
jgi:hypothetical protein